MWCTMEIKEIQRKLKTSLKIGLTEEEAMIRQEIYGFNQLKKPHQKNTFIRFLQQLNDFMIIVLLIASAISASIAYIQGSNDYVDSIMIVFIVFLNATAGFIQENKAEKTIEALKKLAAPKAKVKRNGIVSVIDSEKLVPGDIVEVEAGDYVPADCRLINSFHLKAEESALTGENIPVEKDAHCILSPKIPVGDMKNMIFATTMIASGHAEAVVVDTGMHTNVGKIAQMMMQEEAPVTPLQKKLRRNRKKIRDHMFSDLCFDFYHRSIQKNTYN